MDLRIAAPRPKIAQLQQLRAKHCQECPPVEPVVAQERGLRQHIRCRQRLLEQANLITMSRDIVPPSRELMRRGQSARGLGKPFVSFREKAVNDAKFANIRAVGRGEEPLCGRRSPCWCGQDIAVGVDRTERHTLDEVGQIPH